MRFLSIVLASVLSLVGCRNEDSPKAPSAEQLLTQSKNWDYAYSGVFADGGSFAYGFINEEGLLVYLIAYSPMRSPERRTISLQRSYNDAEATVVEPNSNLEAVALKVVENANEYPWMKGHMPELEDLKAMLRDRSTPFPKDRSEQVVAPNGP